MNAPRGCQGPGFRRQRGSAWVGMMAPSQIPRRPFGSARDDISAKRRLPATHLFLFYGYCEGGRGRPPHFLLFCGAAAPSRAPSSFSSVGLALRVGMHARSAYPTETRAAARTETFPGALRIWVWMANLGRGLPPKHPLPPGAVIRPPIVFGVACPTGQTGWPRGGSSLLEVGSGDPVASGCSTGGRFWLS